MLSKWIVFIKYAADESKKDLIEKVRRQEEAIDMAANTLQKLSQDERERIKYEDRQKWLLDMESSREYIRRKSIQEGLEQGLEQGLVQGLEQGREEKEVEIVKNLFALGADAAFIAKATGLTEEKILKLKEESDLRKESEGKE